MKREAESIEQGLKDLHEERQRVVLRKQQLQNMRDDMQRQLIAAKNGQQIIARTIILLKNGVVMIWCNTFCYLAKEKQGKSANTEKEINKAELKATVQSSGLSIKPLDSMHPCLCNLPCNVTHRRNITIVDLNRFTFKFIDPKDWDKKFYFDLRLGKDKYYSGT